MTLPPRVELRARCSEASDLSGLIFEMQITAGSKNAYRILFPKTTPQGCSALTAGEVTGQFTDHWEMALMDYNGTLEAAVEIVTLRLFDPAPAREHYDELLAWPLFTHERSRWESRREFLDDLLSCRNEQFTFSGLSVRLAESPLIYLPLRTSVVATRTI
jgi:hypothetical protein